MSSEARPRSRRRFVPLVVVALVSLAIVAMGWHREVSLESLARHHAWLQDQIRAHEARALAAYVGLYVAAVALSLPVGAYCSVIGGILFGTVRGGAGAVVGATLGAICVFLIARSAFGEQLVRRAGATAQRIAKGFRADAFSYLLFLRLVPVFPFWLVNLVAALAGVRLIHFAAATALGIVPATFAFAFVGSGLESAIVAQERAYHACLAAGRSDCRFAFHADAMLTPRLMAALAALAVLALVPVIVKRWGARHSGAAADLESTRDRPLQTPKSATADLGCAEPGIHNHGPGLWVPGSRPSAAPRDD
jgi:uncharacterized membrane protein YdjX (TVP38/TMEM64 family)